MYIEGEERGIKNKKESKTRAFYCLEKAGVYACDHGNNTKLINGGLGLKQVTIDMEAGNKEMKRILIE